MSSCPEILALSAEDLRGLDPDTEIYLYMALQKFQAVLTTREIRLARLDQFKGAEGIASNAAIDRIAGLAQSDQRLGHEARSALLQGIRFSEKTRAAASCWSLVSPGSAESARMWRRFADNGAGVAVATTIANLHNSVRTVTADGSWSIWVERVTYANPASAGDEVIGRRAASSIAS